MSTIKITIKTENDAFADLPGSEVARILRKIAKEVDQASLENEFGLVLLDANGNTCGKLTVTKPIAPVIRKSSVKFFYEHPGYSYRTAKQLAKAEQHATSKGWLYEWSEDFDGCDCGLDKSIYTSSKTHNCQKCLLFDSSQLNALAARGSICEPSNEYTRIIEAELALEAIEREEL